jgi:hypothetical protein
MRVRDTTGVVFFVLQMAHAAYVLLRDMGHIPVELHDHLLSALIYANQAAFIAFAAAVFWQFSYRWFRIIAALLLFVVVPVLLLVLSARLSSPLETIPVAWWRPTLLNPEVVAYLAQFAIAGLIYFWSLRKEREAVPLSGGHNAAQPTP